MNVSPTPATFGAQALQRSAPAAPAAQPSGGTGFFQNALEGVSDALAEADSYTQQAATGQIEDLSQLTAAAAKAELAVDLTVAFRDRAVASFQQIMQMQI